MYIINSLPYLGIPFGLHTFHQILLSHHFVKHAELTSPGDPSQQHSAWGQINPNILTTGYESYLVQSIFLNTILSTETFWSICLWFMLRQVSLIIPSLSTLWKMFKILNPSWQSLKPNRMKAPVVLMLQCKRRDTYIQVHLFNTLYTKSYWCLCMAWLLFFFFTGSSAAAHSCLWSVHCVHVHYRQTEACLVRIDGERADLTPRPSNFKQR